MLPLALRARVEGKTDARCENEISFPELYAVLGDSWRQDEIRRSTPQGPHCNYLKRSPNICADCPIDQNPYLGDEGRDGDLYRAYEEHSDWIPDAEEFWELHQLGLGKDVEQLSPDEFEVLVAMRRHEEWQRARIMAVEISKILAPIFATKEKK